jgi:fatty-acid desaturase
MPTDHKSWLVNNGAVQAHNVPWAAVPSMGESWRNNHHAFPDSARHGLYPGQLDIGFHVIQLLERGGLVRGVQTPETLPRDRESLRSNQMLREHL